MVYLPAGAPDTDELAMSKLEWQKGPYRNREFQTKWERIIAEWSTRWGTKVRGWWFDGCYWPDEMYRQAEAPNFASFADAARKGNPNGIVAFNPGVKVPIISEGDREDYTAGEIDKPGEVVCPGRRIGQAQAHMLSFLGENWSRGPVRFTTEQVMGWTKDFVARGGVVTWDVPTSKTGLIPDAFVEQLKAAGAGAFAAQRVE
jgi:alpha-L-fucosidase